MKLYEFDLMVLERASDRIQGRWRVKLKPGYYLDTKDKNKIKPDGPKRPVIIPTSSLEHRGLEPIRNPFKWLRDLINKK